MVVGVLTGPGSLVVVDAVAGDVRGARVHAIFECGLLVGLEVCLEVCCSVTFAAVDSEGFAKYGGVALAIC